MEGSKSEIPGVGQCKERVGTPPLGREAIDVVAEASAINLVSCKLVSKLVSMIDQ